MRIGIFDSGLGGLFVMRQIVKKLPTYDYVYLGDTKRVPYGNRSHDTILAFTKEALEFLFTRDCSLVILACNSASAQALRQIQQRWLPKNYPDKKVLGVIIPTVEKVTDHKQQRIGILATASTVASNTFVKEIRKRDKRVVVVQQAAPLLVPLVESGELQHAQNILGSYLKKLGTVDSLVLGCTHYGILLPRIKRLVGPGTTIISQNTVIPEKLKNYLERHSEIDQKLSKKGARKFFVTDLTPTMQKTAHSWFGPRVRLQKTSYTD